MQIERWAIDGYNVMFAGVADPSVAGDLEKRRADLLARCRRVKAGVTVFFDASKAPPLAAPPPDGRGRLEVVFVRSGTADDAIVAWLRTQGQTHEICVVTNDRELAGRVKALRAKTARVEEFLKAVDPERLEGAEKPRISANEAREWAKEFGVDPDARI
ncbi:MAG: NYN domain-containing protein [Candidatus Brocadiae bacterium]|nr:NYN domain-containing protein [Candidatus Brocadiia bacterium]